PASLPRRATGVSGLALWRSERGSCPEHVVASECVLGTDVSSESGSPIQTSGIAAGCERQDCGQWRERGELRTEPEALPRCAGHGASHCPSGRPRDSPELPLGRANAYPCGGAADNDRVLVGKALFPGFCGSRRAEPWGGSRAQEGAELRQWSWLDGHLHVGAGPCRSSQLGPWMIACPGATPDFGG